MSSVVQASPSDLAPCFDGGNPFRVIHHGKLSRTFDLQTPPFGHCVTSNPGDGTLSIVRFNPLRRSPENPFWLKNSCRVIDGFPNADAAAETHERHLKQLGKLGLTPWVKIIAPGVCTSLGNVEGVFMQQDVLPDYTQPLIAVKAIQRYTAIIRRYFDWAQSDGCVLSDIYSTTQGSILDGQLILHDIEPIYEISVGHL